MALWLVTTTRGQWDVEADDLVVTPDVPTIALVKNWVRGPRGFGTAQLIAIEKVSD